MTELWDAYDEKRQPILGKVIDRETFSQMDDFHLVVEVLIIHDDGSILLMHRCKEKASHPDVYEASAGGSVLRGETSREAAHREALEETGLILDELTLLYQYTVAEHHSHYDRFLARTSAPKDSITYQLGETDNHQWVFPDQLQAFFCNHKVLASHVEELRFLFDIAND